MHRWLALSFILIVSLSSCESDILTPEDFAILSFSPTEGMPGTIVTIKGSKLIRNEDTADFYFGSNKASIITANASRMVVVAPDGSAGPCQVAAILGGDTAVAKDLFTYPQIRYAEISAAGVSIKDLRVNRFHRDLTESIDTEYTSSDILSEGWGAVNNDSNWCNNSPGIALSFCFNTSTSFVRPPNEWSYSSEMFKIACIVDTTNKIFKNLIFEYSDGSAYHGPCNACDQGESSRNYMLEFENVSYVETIDQFSIEITSQQLSNVFKSLTGAETSRKSSLFSPWTNYYYYKTIVSIDSVQPPTLSITIKLKKRKR